MTIKKRTITAALALMLLILSVVSLFVGVTDIDVGTLLSNQDSEAALLG